MEIQIDPWVIGIFSVILTWVVDMLTNLYEKLSEIFPGLRKIISMTGWTKQVLAAAVGFVVCSVANVNVFPDSGIGGEILTGIILAAIAGLGWSKIDSILGNIRDGMTKPVN